MLLAWLSLIVVPAVTLTQELVSVGQRNHFPQNRVFFLGGVCVDPHVGCTEETQKLYIQKEDKLNSNKRCITGILALLNKHRSCTSLPFPSFLGSRDSSSWRSYNNRI